MGFQDTRNLLRFYHRIFSPLIQTGKESCIFKLFSNWSCSSVGRPFFYRNNFDDLRSMSMKSPPGPKLFLLKISVTVPLLNLSSFSHFLCIKFKLVSSILLNSYYNYTVNSIQTLIHFYTLQLKQIVILVAVFKNKYSQCQPKFVLSLRQLCFPINQSRVDEKERERKPVKFVCGPGQVQICSNRGFVKMWALSA